MKKLKIALFCNDVIGGEYLNAISMMDQFHLAGYCGNTDLAQLQNLDIPFFVNPEELIANADAAIVLMPQARQFEIARMTLKNLKHLFIEKPLTSNINEAETLISMQREADVKIMTGPGLRLNKAFTDADTSRFKPQYIDTQNYKINNGSNSVVLDLMINDIDIILQLTKSEVRRISANAVCISNDTPDIVNARIEFGNGCVATLTANRLAEKNMHCTRVFQKGSSAFIDFLQPYQSLKPESAYKIAAQMQATEKKLNEPEESDPKQPGTIVQNLSSFYDSITNNTTPPVTLYDGYRALKLAYQIIDKIEERGMEG